MNAAAGTTDLLRLYLQDIGRVDLLTNEEEVTLARLVQRREALLLQQRDLAESHEAIGELHRLEELQRREANQHSHWPTKQEWARAAGLPSRNCSTGSTRVTRPGHDRPIWRPKS